MLPWGMQPRLLFIPFAAQAELTGAIALASARYRAALPAQALNAMGIKTALADYSRVQQPGLAEAELIVIMQPKEQMLAPSQGRDYWPRLFDFIARQRQAGKRVALDVSDLKIGPGYRAHLAARAGEAAATAAEGLYRRLCASVDLLVAPTPALADLLRAALGDEAPDIVAIPDPVEVTRQPPRFAPGSVPGAIPKLLWFGTFGSHADALRKLLQDDLAALNRPLDLLLLCESLSAEILHGLQAPRINLRAENWSLPALEAALAACDAVLLPFNADDALAAGKSNNRALQTLQAGRYFLAHDIASYRELAAYGHVGPHLGQALQAALNAPAAIPPRIAAGQAMIDAHYTPAAVARLWAELL